MITMDANVEQDVGAVDRLLAIAVEWSSEGAISRSAFTRLIDDVDLPASDYRRAVAALRDAGIAIVDDTDGGPDDPADDEDAVGAPVDGLSEFMRRSRHRILTHAEEYALGVRMDRGRLAEAALTSNPSLDAASRRAFRAQVGDGHAAADEMAMHNVRLVIDIAKRYIPRTTPGIAFDDLIQEGYLGLAHAVAKWDHTRELKFSTYATWWIRQSITRAIANTARTVRLPVHAVELLHRIVRAQRELASGRRPASPHAVAVHLDIPEKTVRELLAWRRGVASLDRLVGHGDTALGDLIRDPHDSATEVAAELGILRETIDDVLHDLTDREAAIVSRRFGLDDGAPETLEEIGRDFGVTRERIRQIESKAMAKLRVPARARRLRDFIDQES